MHIFNINFSYLVSSDLLFYRLNSIIDTQNDSKYEILLKPNWIQLRGLQHADFMFFKFHVSGCLLGLRFESWLRFKIETWIGLKIKAKYLYLVFCFLDSCLCFLDSMRIFVLM
jgi:hypothetical protein